MSEFNKGKPVPVVIGGEMVEVAGIITAEAHQQCDLCGEVAELRPYGPNGGSICFACGQKDKAGTEKMMHQVMFGVSS